MNGRTKILAGGLTFAALVLAAFGALWYFVLDTDSPPPVSIDEAISSAGAPPTGSSGADVAPMSGGDLDLTGDWTLVDDGSSFAGYRIDQEVARIGTETVVGRTQGLTASFSFDGRAISGLQVTADMTGLRSDESLRDGVLRGEALETDAFPTAMFVLSEPITVDRVPAEGERVAQTVGGDLTLHGVTRPIETQVEAVMQGGRLFVVGSNEIQLEDFGMTPPRGPASVLSVEDHGIMEVQLVFEQGQPGPEDEGPSAEDGAPAAGPAVDPY